MFFVALAAASQAQTSHRPKVRAITAFIRLDAKDYKQELAKTFQSLGIAKQMFEQQRWSEGRISLDGLLSYSSVCATGLDTVPFPGDVSAEQIARILGDVASLAYKWHKPLSARLLPVKGKHAGEESNFDDPHLTNATLQPLP